MQKEIIWADNKWQHQKDGRIIPWALEDLRTETDFIVLSNYPWLIESDYPAALEKLMRALPRPALATTAAPSVGEQRQVELGYLDFLQLKKLAADKFTPLGGYSQQRARPIEIPQTFELLRLGQLREERAASRMTSKR